MRTIPECINSKTLELRRKWGVGDGRYEIVFGSNKEYCRAYASTIRRGIGLTTGFIGSHTVTHNYSVYTL
jgi:hypothetical protein